MPTIDVQVHAYERNHPGRPWVGTLVGPEEVTGDEMVAAMDEVGVDGAILVSPFSMYGYDASYALEVRAKHPGKFGLVKPVDPNDPAVADTIADWAAKDGTVGIRIMMRDTVSTDPADPGLNRVLAAAARHSMPINLLCWGRLEQAGQLAARHPNTQLVITISACSSPSSRHRPPSPGPSCRRCWRSRLIRMSRSRSAAPARCRTRSFRITTSGIRWRGSSTPSGSAAACGARTGRARSNC
jgi:predicted TIM-barrel fold metal-dependent hydrolase